jgi:hypothetical protein
MGDPQAPLLGLLAVLAGLGAALAGSRRHLDPVPASAAAGSAAAAMALAAGVLAASEIGRVYGMSPDHALATPAAVAAAGMLLSRVPGLAPATLLLGTGAFGVLVVSMAVGTGAPPWKAWTRLASQPARVFAASAEWVTDGRAVHRESTLAFTETHRITVLTDGVFRVTEAGAVVREWRLRSGDALTLRAGDRLALFAGARLRFEAGKRVPGVAESGVAWAEPQAPAEARALDALGLAVTLGGGAIALVGASGAASRHGAVAAPLALVALVLGAASWGVYAAWLAPDLVIGASPLTSLAAAPLIATPPEVGREAVTVIAIAVGALLLTTAGGLLRRLDEVVAPWASSGLTVRALPGLLGTGALVGAVALARSGVEAEPVLRAALGLGASAWAAPRLAGEGRATAVGAAVGAAVFGALSLAGLLGWDGPPVLGAFPALAAAPLAMNAALLARDPRRARAARRARRARVGCREEETLPQ